VVVSYRLETGTVAVITLNRPERLNAVNTELVEALCAALDRAVYEEVAAAVLTGNGRSFCAGHDLKEPSGATGDAATRRRVERLHDVTRKIRQAPFPVISAVHGYALGAGCEFALLCDLVVASSDAMFGFPEVGVGLGVTGGISHVLPVSVGLAKAKELVLLGRHFPAGEAARMGLVNRVTEPGQALATAISLAVELSNRPRQAVGFAKHLLDRGAQSGIDGAYQAEVESSVALGGTAEARSAAEAFRSRSASRATARPGSPR
jgi:2-(1,2-epoxy-1,2-dihydrophenyl)acetyl-CoA isomerase